MATSWGEDSSLADLKSRLDKLRVNQARQAAQEEEEEEAVDTLKLLEAKFGSPVYDPTSPAHVAYARRCARAGRRQSIEFEDLYLTKASQHLLRPPGAKRNPSAKKESGGDQPHQGQGHIPHAHPHHTVLAHERQRKISDPTAYYKRLERQASTESHARVGSGKKTTGKTRRISRDHGHRPREGQGQSNAEGKGHGGGAGHQGESGGHGTSKH